MQKQGLGRLIHQTWAWEFVTYSAPSHWCHQCCSPHPVHLPVSFLECMVNSRAPGTLHLAPDHLVTWHSTPKYKALSILLTLLALHWSPCLCHSCHSHCLHHPPHTPHPLLPSTVKADYMFGNGREKQSVSRWVAISEGLVSFWCWKVSVWISLVCSTHLYHSPCSSPCTAPHWLTWSPYSPAYPASIAYS